MMCLLIFEWEDVGIKVIIVLIIVLINTPNKHLSLPLPLHALHQSRVPLSMKTLGVGH